MSIDGPEGPTSHYCEEEEEEEEDDLIDFDMQSTIEYNTTAQMSSNVKIIL